MSKSTVVKDLVVPVRKWTRHPGAFAFPKTMKLASMFEADALPLAQLKDELKTAGVRAQLRMGAPEASVFVRRDRALGPEAYRLVIGKTDIEITSAADVGAYYGVQTLRDLIRLNGASLPRGTIDDSPTLARRGVYHDCARGKVPSVETIKQLIEWLAHWKINELQLYIENAFTFAKHPDIGKGFSPYTPDDILAMQAHAKKHHVRFVPSLTSFGHFAKILMLPKYQHLGELAGGRGMPGGTTLCPGDPGSIRLLSDMYDEFLPLFEAEDFNACGDEPWELGKGRSRRRCERVGTGRVYVDFILKLRKLAHRHGKRLNIWADIVMKRPEALPYLPKDVCLLNWQYGKAHDRIDRSHEIRDNGLAFMGCSGTGNWGSHGSRLHDAILNVSRFATAVRENGGEGLLHTDWGNLGHRNYLGTSLCSLAHGAAHAWMNEKVDDKKHIRRFTHLVFGDPKGEFAKALSRLGESPIGVNQPQYFALLESLTGPKKITKGGHIFGGFRIENILSIDRVAATPAMVARRAEAVRAIKWPKPTRPLSALEAPAMEEYAAATHMEAVGCDHINLARELRAGRAPSSAHLRRHATDLETCAKEQERLWRMRNRPSRLCDNLAVLRAGAREARKLASR